MNEEFNTGWDPHQELLTCTHNIGQLVLATQSNIQNVKELVNKYNHQQEIIEQLMFQNRRLNQLLEVQRLDMARIKQQLDEKTQ
jgi:cell shape-determining protein MreC